MRVQRVLMPDSGVESWTLLGKDFAPIEPVERFLAYLAWIERSPNTVKAYAHDLKDWFTYLVRRGLDWRSVTLEDVGGYVAWLRLPPAARDGRVVVLPMVEHHCTASSVNRKLAALTSSTTTDISAKPWPRLWENAGQPTSSAKPSDATRRTTNPQRSLDPAERGASHPRRRHRPYRIPAGQAHDRKSS
jgi:hypothetical protein